MLTRITVDMDMEGHQTGIGDRRWRRLGHPGSASLGEHAMMAVRVLEAKMTWISRDDICRRCSTLTGFRLEKHPAPGTNRRRRLVDMSADVNFLTCAGSLPVRFRETARDNTKCARG